MERLKNAFQNGKIERWKDGKTLFKMEKLKNGKIEKRFLKWKN